MDLKDKNIDLVEIIFKNKKRIDFVKEGLELLKEASKDPNFQKLKNALAES